MQEDLIKIVNSLEQENLELREQLGMKSSKQQTYLSAHKSTIYWYDM